MCGRHRDYHIYCVVGLEQMSQDSHQQSIAEASSNHGTTQERTDEEQEGESEQSYGDLTILYLHE